MRISYSIAYQSLSCWLNGAPLMAIRPTSSQIERSFHSLVWKFTGKYKMNKILIVGLLCVVSSLAFELPMVIDIGGFNSLAIPRISHQVLAAGPFVTPRNVTFNFVWDTPDYTIHGIRLRGSEPRYDRVAVTVNRLDQKSVSIDVTVTQTSFALFWFEPHGFEDIVPASKSSPLPKSKLVN